MRIEMKITQTVALGQCLQLPFLQGKIQLEDKTALYKLIKMKDTQEG